VAWASEGCLPKRLHWPFVVSGLCAAVYVSLAKYKGSALGRPVC